DGRPPGHLDNPEARHVIPEPAAQPVPPGPMVPSVVAPPAFPVVTRPGVGGCVVAAHDVHGATHVSAESAGTGPATAAAPYRGGVNSGGRRPDGLRSRVGPLRDSPADPTRRRTRETHRCAWESG